MEYKFPRRELLDLIKAATSRQNGSLPLDDYRLRQLELGLEKYIDGLAERKAHEIYERIEREAL